MYLLGSWTLSKTLTYTRGGVSGSFLGQASFSPLAGAPHVLTYEESGVATLGPSAEQFQARHALLYDCGDEDVVRVSFDEASHRQSACEVLSGSRFFHSIDLREPDAPFAHPCGPDMYYGRLLCSNQDEFVLDWRVEGPRKLGRIISRFRRRDERQVSD